MDFDHFLMGLRIVLHFGTFLLIASYRPPTDAKYKPWVSLLAACIAGASFSLVVINVLQWHPPTIATVKEMVLTTLVGCFFVLTYISKGDVANMLPRRAWPR